MMPLCLIDRCLTKNSSAIIELALERSICLELYKDFKDLGRITLRYLGTTIAAGLVTEVWSIDGLHNHATLSSCLNGKL